MKVVIQRVQEASVQIEGHIKGKINQGYMILLGIEGTDTTDDIDWLINKIVSLRIFSDAEGKMNLNISAVEGSILLISQFTLYASTKKGNRPSFIKAAPPSIAIPLYETFIKGLEARSLQVETGEFGADMKVSLINDGPVTIIIDSKNRV